MGKAKQQGCNEQRPFISQQLAQTLLDIAAKQCLFRQADKEQVGQHKGTQPVRQVGFDS
ncbi:hypothetical protein D3C71_2221570 [compost metagenome]